jgi:hypothetical protein
VLYSPYEQGASVETTPCQVRESELQRIAYSDRLSIEATIGRHTFERNRLADESELSTQIGDIGFKTLQVVALFIM